MKGTVLVTAVGSFSAAAVIETCKAEGYRVIGCDIYPPEWIAASLETDRFFQAPYATDGAHYLEFLEKICAENQIDFLLPLTDVEIDVIDRWRSRARALGVTLCMSGEAAIGLCRDKQKLAQYLKPLRICPVIPGRSLSQVLSEAEAGGFEPLAYPLVLKPFRGRSSQGLRIIENVRQMQRAGEDLRGEAAHYLVQPKIPGPVVTVDVVRDAEHGRTVCLPRRELLRTFNGAGTSVYVFRDPLLEKQCAALAEALDIRGCVNFEFIEKTETERYLLECNPRFSGGAAFSRMAGYDMVKNHLRCFAGGEIEPAGEIKNQYLVKRYTEFCTKIED